MPALARVFLLCSSLCALHYGGSTNCQTKAYNDLSKVIKVLQKGYLLYETDQDNEFVCNTITRKSVTADNKEIVLEGSYRGTTNSTEQSFTQVISVGECPEDFEMDYTEVSDTGDLSGDLDKPYKGKVVYSDYKSCVINTDPFHTSGCRMWILNDASLIDISKCLGTFNTYCGYSKREVYNVLTCGIPP